MDGNTQAAGGYYIWDVPDSPVVIRIHLDVIDRLGPEVMRGFGAVPKRGAEVGGVLLGTIEPGRRPVVRIEDFEPVACAYKRGPSYLFTEGDAQAFEDAVERWRPGGSHPAYAVGFYRSHTRDGLTLSEEDLELMDHYFGSPEHVALLIKPFATKVSVAGFFVREGGRFPKNTPLEFPLRRQELSGEEPPVRRPLGDRKARRSRGASVLEERPPEEPAEQPEAIADSSWDMPQPVNLPGAAYAVTAPAKSRFRWIWWPLSFVFLLLGVVLGFQAGLTVAARNTTVPKADSYAMDLSVSRMDENLTVRWNREAPVVRAAAKGVLEIEEGGYTKPVDLDASQLQGGSILYHRSSDQVRFRMTLYLNSKLSVTETLDWRQ